MKINRLYIVLLAILAVSFVACNDDEYVNESPFENVVYIDVAEVKNVVNMTFKQSITEQQKELSAMLAYPSDVDVEVEFQVDPNLVGVYNSRNETKYTMLDTKYFSLSAQKQTVEAGRVASSPIVVSFTALDQLEIDVTYLVPITITGATNIDILTGSATVYYLVRRSSAIVTAAKLGKGNWMSFPTLDKKGPQSDLFNGLTAVTFEALVRIDNFNPQAKISSIMGVEQYLLFRFGDEGFARQQLQFDGSGASFGKFPKRDDLKALRAGEWYHVAATYDQVARTVRIFVNGELQSEDTEAGSTSPAPFNLAMRAMADADPEGSSDLLSAYQFFIGRSYDENRPLNGEIAEVRVWSKARSQQEIWESMYGVEPTTAGLIGYWKFDEGTGNVVKDATGNGNDAIAEIDLEWPDGIEIPQLNK